MGATIEDIPDTVADRMTLACIAGQDDPGKRNVWAVGT
jgi:hypothetical protein